MKNHKLTASGLMALEDALDEMTSASRVKIWESPIDPFMEALAI